MEDAFKPKGWKNHENSEAESIRRELLKLAEENRLLKEDRWVVLYRNSDHEYLKKKRI